MEVEGMDLINLIEGRMQWRLLWTEQCTVSIVTNSCTYLFKKKLRGLSPRANYTDRAAAAGR